MLCTSSVASIQPIEFSFIIPMYNNIAWYRQCLDSVASQKGIDLAQGVIIDDASTDGTADAVEQYLAAQPLLKNFRLIRNPKRMGIAYNRFHGVHMLPDESVVIALDGDDFLNGVDVLDTLGEVFKSQDIWVAHSTYMLFSSMKKGSYCKEVPRAVLAEGKIRHYPFCMSHLRSFKAWLFKLIPEHYFKAKGVWLPSATDLAMMFALTELAGTRIAFIDKPLCIYNDKNSISIFRTARARNLVMEQLVRRMTPLKKLERKPGSKTYACSKHLK